LGCELKNFFLPPSRYIAAEQIPVKYGGLSKDGEFGSADAVTEITVKPAAKHTVEFPVTEVGFAFSLLTGSNMYRVSLFSLLKNPRKRTCDFV
jgi:hypothetical protein